MMTDAQKALVAGAFLNSALYLTCAFVAGLMTGNPIAWRAALASMGLAFLCYVFQLMGERPFWRYAAAAAVAASIGAGVWAGVTLLFGGI